jgi:hypothetical protein
MRTGSFDKREVVESTTLFVLYVQFPRFGTPCFQAKTMRTSGYEMKGVIVILLDPTKMRTLH